MKPDLFHLFVAALQEIGLGLLVLGVVTGIISIIRVKGEYARSFKLRTILFIIAAFAVRDFWAVTIPFFLFMAYRSYRAGAAEPAGPTGLYSLIRLIANWLDRSVPVRVVNFESENRNQRDHWGRRNCDYGMDGNPLPGTGFHPMVNKYTGEEVDC